MRITVERPSTDENGNLVLKKGRINKEFPATDSTMVERLRIVAGNDYSHLNYSIMRTDYQMAKSSFLFLDSRNAI